MTKQRNIITHYPLLAVAGGLAVFFALAALLQSGAQTAQAGKLLAVASAWGVLLVLMAAGARATYGWLKELGYSKKQIAFLVVFLVATALAGTAFFSLFFSMEQEIKTYDSTVYWIKSIDGRALLADSLPQYALRLRESMAREYTDLAAFPLIPLSYAFGQEFSGYCLSVFLLYYLPACLFLTVFTLRLVSLGQKAVPATPRAGDFITCFCLCALCVSFLWPAMKGYLDVAGVLLMALLLNVILRWNGVDFTVKRILTLTVLSMVLLLTRRWYAYYIVGLYFSFGLYAVLDMALCRTLSLRKVGLLIRNLGIIAGISALCLFVLNPRIYDAFLGTDYSVAYSAFKTRAVWDNIFEMLRNLGLLWAVAAIAGTLWLLKNAGTRLKVFWLLTAVAVAAALFFLVQDMGYHQQYLILPTVLVLACVFCIAATAYARQHSIGGLSFVFIGICAANFSFGYVPAMQNIGLSAQPLTTQMRSYPQKENDIDLIRQIVTDLENKTQNTSYSVYVVGDSKPISPERLRRSFLPRQTDVAPFILENNIVDLRDGFPSQLFLAEYILLSDPFQTYFATPQQVSYQVYDLLVRGEEFAPYYELETRYPSEGANILLFRKVKPADTVAIDLFKERLQHFYPEQGALFEPNYAVALANFAPEANYLYNYWERAFMIEKKPGLPFELRLNDVSRFSTLSFAMSCWTPGLDLVVSDEQHVILQQTLDVAEKVPYTLQINDSNVITFSIVESDSGNAVDASLILFPQQLQ